LKKYFQDQSFSKLRATDAWAEIFGSGKARRDSIDFIAPKFYKVVLNLLLLYNHLLFSLLSSSNYLHITIIIFIHFQSIIALCYFNISHIIYGSLVSSIILVEPVPDLTTML
jgi:hypothetical protein